MSLPRPTLEALDQAARRIGLNLDDATLRAYERILEATFAEYDQVDALIDQPPVVRYPRTPGVQPEDNPLNATRILDAGGRIVGKAHCEYFCVSGSSHTNATGPVRNPRMPEHSAGGSSSGAAALVGAGEADMAIGTDQGGSVRIPAAYSGIYGMKPTHGLIP